MDSVYVIVVMGAVVAGFVQGLSGFAFGMVAISFWAWVLEPQLAALLAIFGALTGQIIGVFSVRREMHLSRLWPFIAGGLAGIPIGMVVLPYLNIDWFKVLLGTFLIIWCPVILFSAHLPAWRFGGRGADGVIGVVGGIMSGIGGMSGAVPTLWCILRGFDKGLQRTVIQNFNLFILSVTMVAYLFSGRITTTMLPMFGLVAVSVLIPVIFGAKLYIGISDLTFRRIVLTLLTLSGVMMLVSSLPRVWQ